MSSGSTLRGTGAVLLGLIAANVLSNISEGVLVELKVYPDDATAYGLGATWAYFFSGAAYTAVGGYMAAWFAPKYPLAHAATMGLLNTLFAGAYFVSLTLDGSELWTGVLAVATPIPSALIGGWIYARKSSSVPATP